MRLNYRDQPAADNDGNIVDFPNDNNKSASFKFKQKTIGQTGDGNTKDVEIMAPLFWEHFRILEMSLVNC